MSTPILNPNSLSTTNRNTNVNSSLSQIQIELSKILHKHDPTATRLYDFLNHVKIFHYNLNEFRWENNPLIEGNLFAYKKQKFLNNEIYSSFAFAVINKEYNFIQEITIDMQEYASKLLLFYEIIKNDQRHIFCIYFINENECQRLHTFIKQSIPVINENSNTEDQTSSLKRLLNIPKSEITSQQSINLIPPSAYEILPTSSLNIKCDNKNNREYFYNILVHLIQNNNEFCDKIQQSL